MVSRLKRIYTVFEFKIDESKSTAYKSWNFEMRETLLDLGWQKGWVSKCSWLEIGAVRGSKRRGAGLT
jgi:hypothetical protein